MDASPEQASDYRLAALRSFNILDTPREQDFDEIVALAARLCDVPVALVSLVDADRQWFKAEVGLACSETPIEQSICAHVIRENSFVEIPDTHADERTRDNPLCQGEDGLRFYAGALLRTAAGVPLGTLCVLDRRPRTLEPHQREALEVLARQVMTQIDLRQAIATEQVIRNEIDHRIKNSLSTVAAFVRLERRTAADKAALQLLDRVAQQIDTVSLLHRHLSDGGRQRLDLATYLGEVVALIDQSQPPAIHVSGEFAPFDVEAREAANLGTVVNELAANAVKHSVGEAGGEIRFRGEALTGGRYRLTSEATGARTGDETETEAAPGSRTGLGLRLIAHSVQQLGGTMTRGTENGRYRTEIVVTPSPA
ncbi:GAF domain-containing protein [Sphingomonas astaxanthinifaciens]|uniref:Sensor histidine kinase n=1 Tax=Sphingomonas astaxanthinifaciens DSM 22298 TaxID=1123267 RepID=A0ABQ5Z8L0_9SPHN|nr:GAF domain-containing protein [Sphingomonas astaxanthinifaciens]GLR48330.1 sensor histidine kinase [Sphingomonas astaxanthinifaciens DSM 22298]